MIIWGCESLGGRDPGYSIRPPYGVRVPEPSESNVGCISVEANGLSGIRVEEEYSIEVREELLPPLEVVHNPGGDTTFGEFGGGWVRSNECPNATHEDPT